MFDYTICNAPDSDIFLRQCKALEKNIPDLEKERNINRYRWFTNRCLFQRRQESDGS